MLMRVVAGHRCDLLGIEGHLQDGHSTRSVGDFYRNTTIYANDNEPYNRACYVVTVFMLTMDF